MNKFKDFLYDKSDILIAIAILLVAALIIAWRLSAIVEYPKEIIDNNDNSTEYTEDETQKDEGTTDPPADPPKDEKEDATQSDALWSSDGLLTRDVTVTWSGYGAREIIQCAVDAGIFEDYDEYANFCLNNGISEPDRIPGAESSTFAAGSSKVDIVLQIHNK